MSQRGCTGCGCVIEAPAHALVQALRQDDLDSALEQGLVDALPCPSCSPACADALVAARDERRAALAARERYRSRQARLDGRAARRAAARAVRATAADPAPPLPAGAADVLARALLRARKSP